MSTDEAPKFPRSRDWWLLAAAIFVLLSFYLGVRGLNEPDEGRYANIALGMLTPGGGWWEPRMSGFAHYDKPPLIYWTTALCFRVFGVNEWAARIPSFIGAVLALTGLGWAAFRLYGVRVAWWAVLIGGTGIQFWALAHVLSPDMLLTGWCTLGVAAWAECRHRGGRWRWWSLSLLVWTLAWWTKATPALIPLAGLLVGVWMTGDKTGRKALRIAWLVPAIVALGSPWYLSMLHEHPELKSFFFGRELAGRMAGRVDGRHGSVFYYVPVSLIGWLPWWPLAAWFAWRDRALRRVGVEGWIVLTGLLIFSLAASKLPTYTLTLYPWAALVIARVIAGHEQAAPVRQRRLLMLPAAGFAGVGLVGLVVLSPRQESNLAVNSSMREVCRFLKDRHATRVDSDRYWAGMEFYLDPRNVHYVIHVNDAPVGGSAPGKAHRTTNEHYHERASDPGVPPYRFVDPDAWPSLPESVLKTSPEIDRAWWLVRFRKQGQSPFADVLTGKAENLKLLETVKIGSFDVCHVSPNP